MESDSLTEKAVFSPSETFLLNSWITYRLGGQKARESPENAFFAILPYSDTLPGLGGGVPHHVEGCSRARIVPTAKTADILSLVLLLMAPAYVLPLAVIEDSRTPESIQEGESISSRFGTFGGIRLPPQNFGTAGSRIPRAYSRVRKVRFLTC